MIFDVYIIGKETDSDIERFTNGNDALKFIEDNDYKVYTAYYASYDRMIFEVSKCYMYL